MFRSRRFILLACLVGSAACSKLRTSPPVDAGSITPTAASSASVAIDAGADAHADAHCCSYTSSCHADSCMIKAVDALDARGRARKLRQG